MADFARTEPPPPPPALPYPRGIDLIPLRFIGDLDRASRLELQQIRHHHLDLLAEVDVRLAELTQLRLDTLDVLDATRDQLWPRLGPHHVRRPPALDRPLIPPAHTAARPVHGRHLRQACLTLLARAGTLTLTELHARLHTHGFVIRARHPVKCLADAMGYEVRLGRAHRVRRATYGIGPDPTEPSPSATRRRPPPPAPLDAPTLSDRFDAPALPESGAAAIDPDPGELADPGRWWRHPDDHADARSISTAARRAGRSDRSATHPRPARCRTAAPSPGAPPRPPSASPRR
ncbi:MAG: hypothetical protein KDB33_21330, partial [Acidimicrobiales bacterium]|nr:hypothetical protein [Acidimicrobiales bacterium]